jgi:hypothetical protein
MMSKQTRCPAVTPWNVSRKPSPLLSMAGSGSQPRAASPAVFASMWSTKAPKLSTASVASSS